MRLTRSVLRTWLGASLVLVGGCGSDRNIRHSAAGSWTGTCELFQVTLNLEEESGDFFRGVGGKGSFVDAAGKLGTLWVDGFNEAEDTGVTGYSFSPVLLNFHCDSKPCMADGQFNGNFSGPNRLSGTFGPPPLLGTPGPQCLLDLYRG